MKTYQTNDTASPMYVGGVMIPSGEGRWVEGAADARAPAPALEPEPVPTGLDVSELAAKPVKDIVAEITARAESGEAVISGEMLEALASAEEARDKPRSSLLAAIEEEWLRRAAEAAAADEAAKAAAAENDGA